MSKKTTQDYAPPAQGAPAAKQSRKKKKGSGLLGRIIRRFFLLLFTVILLAAAALVLVMYMVFNGPSTAARDVLTMSLIEASATKWVPALFIGEEAVAEIRASVNAELTDELTNTSKVVVKKYNAITSDNNEWANYPDGIRIERYAGDTYNAHIMIIQNPAQVYMATSTEKFSTSIPGKRINQAIQDEGAIAAINAGAFFDDGTTSSTVGSGLPSYRWARRTSWYRPVRAA